MALPASQLAPAKPGDPDRHLRNAPAHRVDVPRFRRRAAGPNGSGTSGNVPGVPLRTAAFSEGQAGVSPGLPASVTKEAAVVMGAPGVVTADTVLKSARAASLPRVTTA